MKADVNPYETAYRVACKRIGTREQLKLGCLALLPENISTKGQPYNSISREMETTIIIPEGTGEEVLAACTGIADRKTPGPDRIPNRALKVAIRLRPNIFTKVFPKCLVEGVFPLRWKKPKLVLIPKPGKPPGEPSSYWPICLLDMMTCVEAGEALSDLQYGLQKKSGRNRGKNEHSDLKC